MYTAVPIKVFLSCETTAERYCLPASHQPIECIIDLYDDVVRCRFSHDAFNTRTHPLGCWAQAANDQTHQWCDTILTWALQWLELILEANFTHFYRTYAPNRPSKQGGKFSRFKIETTKKVAYAAKVILGKYHRRSDRHNARLAVFSVISICEEKQAALFERHIKPFLGLRSKLQRKDFKKQVS